MCIYDSASTTFISMSCVTVAFDVSVSPITVPSNTGQLLTLGYPGGTLVAGDQVLFVHPNSRCDTSVDFVNAHTTNSAEYSSSATVGASGAVLSFDFDGMRTSEDISAFLCVKSGTDVFGLPSITTLVQAAVVGLAGDPHVRSADGAWLDFFGEAGVYQLLDGDIQANAKFGYAVRDSFMIWHPKVMRPGTLVEEVGVKLAGSGTSMRLGIQGGGIVSVRNGLGATDFWARSDERTEQIGDFTVTWASCKSECEVAMPWGVHQRTHSLTIQGREEFLHLHVAKSGGYRFIDVDAAPGLESSGLLADAAYSSATLGQRLLGGGEAAYKATMATLS